jgi:hypothetical protein
VKPEKWCRSNGENEDGVVDVIDGRRSKPSEFPNSP